MRIRTIVAMKAACLLSAMVVTAAAQTPPPGRGQNPKQMPPQAALGAPDSEFINKAARSGALEVDLAALAIKNSKSPALIAAANKIKMDHEAANKALLAIAKKKNHTPPALTNDEKQMAHGKIMSLKGSDFDKEWVAMMIKGHTESIQRYTDASKSADAEIAAFATKTLPVIKEHLQTLQGLSITLDR